MTINELICLLEEYRDDLGSDVSVRLMTQENWPFENEIFGLASGAEVVEAASESCDEEGEAADEEEPVLYIVEGGQICYGNKAAWDAARSS